MKPTITLNLDAILAIHGMQHGRDYQHPGEAFCEAARALGIENAAGHFIRRTMEGDGMFGKIVPISEYIIRALHVSETREEETRGFLAARTFCHNRRVEAIKQATEVISGALAPLAEFQPAPVSHANSHRFTRQS